MTIEYGEAQYRILNWSPALRENGQPTMDSWGFTVEMTERFWAACVDVDRPVAMMERLKAGKGGA